MKDKSYTVRLSRAGRRIAASRRAPMAVDVVTDVEPRVPMSRERVLRAGIGLADAKGIGLLSMRRLAQELGVEAMTLYYYVANKDDLLNAMMELVEGEIELPTPGAGSWKAALRTTAMSYHEVLGRHPWAAGLALSSTGTRLARWRYMNAVLRTLREAGFSADLTDQGYHALDSHISGFTLWEAQLDIDEEELPQLAESFISGLPEGEFPWLIEHVHQHLKKRSLDDDGSFAFGLDLILDGLGRLLDAGGEAASTPTS